MINWFVRAELGATAVEYALIASLVSVFIIGAIILTGNSMNGMYNVIINAVESVVSN